MDCVSVNAGNHKGVSASGRRSPERAFPFGLGNMLPWSGHISDHIKHVDYVPPPITAPAR
jgi:hypothetical protein